MPHLDAKALTEDPQGMEFLAAVLDCSVDPASPAWGADEPCAVAVETTVSTAVKRSRRKRLTVVSEAA